MTFQEYRQYDALGLAALVKDKKVTPEELLEIATARTDAVNPTINAVVHRLDDYGHKMLSNCPENGVFAGVPFLIKDLGLQVKGTPCNTGSYSLKDYVSPTDSVVVERLRKAGLIFFGKTNTPEFGLTPFTESKLYGPCKNPWNTDHSPGGSSGGAGAAVASGIVPMATASDGGGSIRIPAACNGLLGLKPSRGLSTFRPYAAEAWGGLVVEGCNSRSVRDTAAYLDVIAGMDKGESYFSSRPTVPFSEQIKTPVSILKIGFSTQHTLGLEVDQACKDAINHTVGLLRALGHTVEEVPLPYERADLTDVYVKLVAAECDGDLTHLEVQRGSKMKRSELEPNTWALRLLGKKISAGEFAYARQQMGQIAYRMALWHEKYDLLLTPTISQKPIKIGALQNTKSEAALVNVINRFGLGSLLKASIGQFVDKAFGYIPFPPLANMTGQPSITIPLFWTKGNLPIGTMFTAKMGADGLLLQLAKQLEEAQPWFDKVPME